MKLFVKKTPCLAAITLIASIAIVACSDNNKGLENKGSEKTGSASAVNSSATASLSGSADSAEPASAEAIHLQTVHLDVYKSRTCGCCQEWIDHAESHGFATTAHHPVDLNQLKSSKGITARFQSCHTAVSPKGYVFEGHIDAKTIQRFLANPPANAIGLAVPGMPMGSPGMEMGDRYDAHDVLLLNKDGSSAVYEHISAGHYADRRASDDHQHGVGAKQ